MPNELDSNARCLKAIKLTFRFAMTCVVPLGFLLFGVCLLFGKGYKLGVNAGLIILVLYFAVAYLHVGRGNKISQVIAVLAGSSTASAAAAAFRSDEVGNSNPTFNPATGFMMMGDFDTSGNLYGFGTMSGATSDDDVSELDDAHLRINPANGLLMLDEVIDIQGNVFGGSADDFSDSGSAIGNSMADSSFDDSFNNSTFDDSGDSGTVDDDWNK